MALGASPNVVTVPAQSEIKSLPEFIAKAKANPGKLNWTSPGAGTTPYLAGEVIKLRTGITMEHIPFAGAGPATTAVLGGQVDMYTANIGSVSSLIEGGKVRPLAVTALTRWPELPDVPTLEELGIKDAVADTFYGISSPSWRGPTSRRNSPRPACRWCRNRPPSFASASPARFRCIRRSSTRPV